MIPQILENQENFAELLAFLMNYPQDCQRNAAAARRQLDRWLAAPQFQRAQCAGLTARLQQQCDIMDRRLVEANTMIPVRTPRPGVKVFLISFGSEWSRPASE